MSMNDSVVSRLVKCEQELIHLKAGSETGADSAKLFRMFFDFSGITETRKYRIVVAPKNGDYDNLIVMPIGSTGDVNNIAAYATGMGFDVENQCVLHFERFYDSFYPNAADSFMVYSNAELMVISQDYTN